MREGWTYISFGDIMTPAKVERCGDRIDLPILSITMRSGIILQNDRFKKKIASFDTKDYKIVKNGQLVIAFPIDEGLIYTQDITDQGIMSPAYSIWDVDYSNLNRRFLGYLFHSPFAMNYYKSKLRGTTQRRRMLPKEDLLSFPIPVPPLSEQQRIVSELDLLSSIIEKKKAQLKEYDQLAQSIFYDMFGDPVTNERGWEVKKLGDVCEKITDGTHNSPVNTETGDYMYVTAKNIKKDGITLDNITYVSAKVHKTIYERCNPKFGDVLYIKDGITTGVATINTLKEEFSLLSSVALLKPQKCLINHYLKAVLNMPSQYASIRENMGGAAITRLTIAKINQIIIPLPPLPLQQSFASKIEAIEHQKALVQQSITETESLFNSRMDYYFD